MECLALERRGPVGILRLNRPSSLNALNLAILKELHDLLTLEAQGRIRALIITGTGDRAFAAGADVKEMHGFSQKEAREFCKLGQKVTRLLEAGDWVTIAAVRGYALGGGLELALACDFIYASHDAKFGLPEVKLGLIPGFGGTQRLSRAVGTRLAKELIFTGKTLDAEEALRIGLVNSLFDGEELLKRCQETADLLGQHSFSAIRQAKEAVEHGIHLSLDDGLEVEKLLFTLAFSGSDRVEGMKAFLEKREPVFN